MAGAFFAVQKTVITPEHFNADFSIFFLLCIVAGGLGKLCGPVLGTLVFFGLPELLGPLQSWRLAIYGVMLLALIVFAPHGLMGLPLWRRWQLPPPLPPAPAEPLPALHSRTAAPQALLLRGLAKHFGGVTALQGCTLTAAAGQTHALVGPNGSGKTTTLNLVSGFIRADAGQVLAAGTPEAVFRHPEVERPYMGCGGTKSSRGSP